MFDRVKESIQKFSSKSGIDKEAVEQLVKDIQRDLIQADVDVGLVSELSDEIREEALEGKKDGLSRKEHVLETVYNKMEELLGEEPEIEVKPQKILLAGLYGAGKCVSPNSKIQLSDGRRIAAEELYSKEQPEDVEQLEDGYRFEVEGVSVPSFNPKTMKIEEKPVEYLWKLEKDKKLIEVGLDAGNNHRIQVTPEHPFFTLEKSKVVKKRADELTASDHVAIPRELDIKTDQSLDNIIQDFLTQEFHYKDKKMAKKVKSALIEKHGTLERGFEDLDLEVGYPWFTRLLSVKNEVPVGVPQKLGLDTEFVNEVVHKNSNSHHFNLPKDEEKFLEFLGYLLADGYINDKYLELASGDKQLIERWQKLSKNLFGIEPQRKSDERSEKLEYSRISCKGLVKFICNILDMEPGSKSGKIELPNQLLKFQSENFESFLKAYFDSDGHAHEGRHIEISTKSEEMASQLRTLLLRNGIFSSKSAKEIEDIEYYRITISGSEATKYAEKIGSLLERKQDRLENYRKIQRFQGSGSKDMIPVDGEIQKQRLKACTSISEIQEKVSSYGRYEKNGSISRKALSKSLDVMENQSISKELMQVVDGKNRNQIIKETDVGHSQFNGMISSLKRNGKIEKKQDGTYATKESEKPDLGQLRKLSESDVNWVKVSEIKTTEEHEYVYDLTVKDNHSFIAENTIVHNTTTAGKLADYYRKRGLKTGLIAADTDRPAAYEQLEQLAEKADSEFYGDPEEENPSKVVEEGLEKIDADVIIVDSAGRNSLDEELKEELAEVNQVLNPDESYLVMPADIGQSAKDQASSFDDAVGISGVVVTKMDSSAKGGGALVACSTSGAQVKFIGTGEQVGDLEVYDPVKYVSEMLGQPDLESLLEKVEQLDTDPEELLEGEFTLKQFKDQISQVTETGMMEEMMQQLPFGGKLPDNISQMTEEKASSYEFIIDSMTDEEVNDPSVINRSRRERIAKGSGQSTDEVRELIKHFQQTKNMMDKMDKGSMKRGNMQDMMQKMGL